MGRAAYGQTNTVMDRHDVPVAASTIFEARSGKIIALNSSRHATIATGSTRSDIIGGALVGTMTSSSTAGQDKIAVNFHKEAVYELPINATQTESQLRLLVGKSCDIEVVSDIQYANYDSSSEDFLEIVGYQYYGSGSNNQTLLVKVNYVNISKTGV